MQTTTVTDTVFGGSNSPRRIRWVVAATFAEQRGEQPRCVEYRVRVVPEGKSAMDNLRRAHSVIAEMERQAPPAVDAEILEPIPAEGIPRRVFEEASQARLLAKARDLVARRPARFSKETRRLLEPLPRQPGRPPARSLAEKIRILADADAGFAEGSTRAEIAKRNGLSDSALRDLLGWAGHDHDPPLWRTYGPGRRGGHLTPQGSTLHAALESEGGK